jgi:hypothetical protein
MVPGSSRVWLLLIAATAWVTLRLGHLISTV